MVKVLAKVHIDENLRVGLIYKKKNQPQNQIKHFVKKNAKQEDTINASLSISKFTNWSLKWDLLCEILIVDTQHSVTGNTC